MNERLPFAFPSGQSEILRRRARILGCLCAMDEGFCVTPVRSIAEDTLKAMLLLYDDAFLSGYLLRTFGELRVTLSPRLISSAGKFLYSRSARKRLGQAEIRMSGDFLTRLDRDPFELNGLTVATPQEAFLVVFEHELCHALETALYGSTGHSRRFLALANGLFGHTATRHSLPTRRQEAAEHGLCIGQCAQFLYQGTTLTGIITYIGKTATVMVPSARGAYRDRSGRRYEKYRVAPGHLQRIP